MATVPMLSPDGVVGDVPQENVHAAVGNGFKIGADMMSPDGKLGTVPLEGVHAAIAKGFRLQGAAPAMPNPIQQDISKDQAATTAAQAAGPNTVPGAYEAAGDLGVPISQKLQAAAKPIAGMANMAAPIMTGGASLPVQMAVQGAASGADTAVQGGSAKDIAKDTAIGAAIPAAAHGISAAYQGLKNAIDVKSVQPALQNGVKEVLSKAADELGVSKPTAPIRDVAKELGDSVLSKSKEEFAAIDKATNGEFTNIDRALENLNREIRTRAGISKDVDAALAARKVELEGNMQKAMDAAKAAGVDPAVVDAARGDYKRAQALYDLDGQIKRAVPYSTDPAAQQVNIKGLQTRMNKMLDSGRLGQAVGDEGAKQLMQHGEQAKAAAEQIAARAKLAKRVGTAAVVGAGLTAGGLGAHDVYEAVKK